MKKKSIRFALLAIFLVSILAPLPALADTSITNVTVKPDVNTVGERSRYQITFITNETLTGGLDAIYIRFPSEFRFTNMTWHEGYVEIKSQFSTGVNYSNGLLSILVPRNTTIYAGETVIVYLSASIMTNPASTGEFSFSVSTSKETTPIASPRFQISEYVSADGVSKPYVSMSPVRGYAAEEIAVRFTTNRNGQLIGSFDQIVLDFPNGFKLPQYIDEKTITVNGIQMHSLPPVIVGQRLILPLSPTMNYTEIHPIEIIISANSGVTVDRGISDAVVKVHTTKNTAVVDSFPFTANKTPDQIYIPADDRDPSVAVAPNGAGALGQWTFTFPRNTILLTQGEYVMGFTLIFPNGTILPGSVAAQHITVNNQQSNGALVTPSQRQLIFTLPIGISVNTDITVVISSSAGIQNPPAAVYRMDVTPMSGIKTLSTKAFEIKAVSDVVQTPQPPYTADKVVKLTLNDRVATKDGLAVILDVPPQLIDGFTLVPLRFVTEGLGAVVEYDSTQNTVTLTLGSRAIVLWPGSTLAKVDNVVVTLAKAPLIQDGRTMVPIRFVSECYGADVLYISATEPITITMTADALSKMPSVAEIQAGQANVASSGSGSGTGTGAGTGAGSGSSGSGGGTGVVGRTITLKTGTTNARLRQGPGTNHDIVGIFLPTETATILEVSGDWYHVEMVGYSFKAWIRNDLVELK